MSIGEDSINLHKKLSGKWTTASKIPIIDRSSLSLAYTPGVGAVSTAIKDDPDLVWELTNRRNMVAVVSDGSAVLGLGNIGPEAAMPVMEGKAVLFKEFAGIDAVPICLSTQSVDEIVAAVIAISPGFGGINLEDISAPRCFEVEEKLKSVLKIPVMHDDQHGTAIVVLAALTNALKVVKKDLSSARIIISGAGAAGIAIAKILISSGAKRIIMANSKGLINRNTDGLNPAQTNISTLTNQELISGSLSIGFVDADVFIGVSAPGIVTQDMVRSMAKDSIVMPLANPVPEIMPDLALASGARIVATGRSDFPNQVNNVLAFPGVFKGVLPTHSPITESVKLAAAKALAAHIKDPDETHIIPDCLDKSVVDVVAAAVRQVL